ncbi:MAG: right-handed parallel beta-helix repeat-containing protein [Lachnospiraceae bacterium]|nr:right-handed parallel beta-helix repeat-containing protein [Lachnospiraceae bacterium]
MRYEVKTAAELEAILKNGDESREICLSEGVYEIAHTLTLDSNTTIKGVKGKTILTGSRRVPLNAGAEGIIEIDLEQAGIQDLGRFGLGPFEDFWKVYDIPKPHMDKEGPSLQLFYEEERLPISRYPDEGYLWIKESLGETKQYKKPGECCGAEEGIFRPDDTSIFEKEDCDELLLFGYWFWDWATQRHVIERFDKESGTITVKQPYHVFGYKDDPNDERGGKFYVMNARSAVKKPGDWCISRREKKVYLYPYPGQTYVDISVCENIFEAEGRENISIEDISFTKIRRNAVWFNECRNISVTGCTIKNSGAWAIIADHCSDAVIRECHVSETGAGGIAVSGGDRNTLTNSGILVEKNEIHDIAYWVRTYMPAIELNGVGIVVRSNRIWDVPHFAIDYQGNNNIIEGNDIRNACFESNDAGAIYAGCDCSCIGNIIRYNNIADCKGLNNKGCVGIYFDDGFSGAEVYGNIISNNPYTGVMLGGGREINIHDNIFYECGLALYEDRRVTSWGDSLIKRLKKNLEKVDYQSDIWKEAYPRLYHYLEDEPGYPKYNSFSNNLVIGGYNMAFENKEDMGEHVRVENNRYVKTANDKYWISPGIKDWYFVKE